MPTETNRNQQTARKSALTPRQRKAIPLLVASRTYTEGIEKAGINRTTVYKWLKEPLFKTELERQRDELAREALGILSQSMTKAVETLVGLLDCGDGRLKRLAANDIIHHVLEHREIEELRNRLDAVEHAIDTRKQTHPKEH
jgi:hypothetical protein